MELGRTWTGLIIAQVAIAVAAMPFAMNGTLDSMRLGTRAPARAADEMLRAMLVMMPESPAVAAAAAVDSAFGFRFADRTAELIRRLRAEPEVAAVTFARDFPGLEAWAAVEVEPVEAWTERVRRNGSGFSSPRVRSHQPRGHRPVQRVRCTDPRGSGPRGGGHA